MQDRGDHFTRGVSAWINGTAVSTTILFGFIPVSTIDFFLSDIIRVTFAQLSL